LSSRAAALLVVCLLAAPAAHATWTEAGNVTIRIVGELGGLDLVEASQIGLVADVFVVFVGSASEVGTLTVSQQTDEVRTDLGGWTIVNGQGNVGGVFGDGVFRVGSGTSETATPGVLEFVSSDVTGGVDVRNGNCNVRGGSSIGNVDVFPFGRLDVVEASAVDRLTTHDGSLTLVQDSFATSTSLSSWSGDMRIDDSIVSVDALRVFNGGDVEIGLASFGGAELTMTGNLEVRDAELAIARTEVSTGSIDMRGIASSLDVANGTWTNADYVDFHPSGTVGPVTIDVHGGAIFHANDLRVSGHAAYQHLQVRGDGTELDANDFVIGEYQGGGGPTGFTGNVTVSDGAIVVVHGTLIIGSQAVLNIESGATVYAMDVDDDGTVVENGGQLIVPEPEAAEEAMVACAGIAAIARRSRARC
jgi:hypothetical protein